MPKITSTGHKGVKHSQKTKIDISQKIKALWKDENFRKKMILRFKGRNYNNIKNKFPKGHIPWIKGKSKYGWIICNGCGKEFYVSRQKKIYCTHKCYTKNHIVWNKGKSFLANELNPNWRGGIGKLPYSYDFTDKLKEDIRKRDDYACQNCKMTEEEHLIVYGRKLHIHHIDYNKQNCQKENLISLCVSCNFRANYNREYWKKHYLNFLYAIPIFSVEEK